MTREQVGQQLAEQLGFKWHDRLQRFVQKSDERVQINSYSERKLWDALISSHELLAKSKTTQNTTKCTKSQFLGDQPQIAQRLAEIQARCEKATPGEWEVYCDLNIQAPDQRGGKLSPFSTSSLSHEQRYDNVSFAAHARTDIPFLLELLSQREQQRWIAVSNRLPEIGQNILVHGGMAQYRSDGWWTYMECPMRRIQWHVTHWRPLPAPPYIPESDKEKND